ncbi:MAG TPA: PhnD/SsuA/transferrin family substrate-binding protein, partial [Gemmataceae bacterium]|nr:PhnD/SsuA/transferrin family substrate-binding protein [Gemmataceae bacterium]
MALWNVPSRRPLAGFTLVCGLAAVLALAAAPMRGRQAKIDVLHIGTSASLGTEKKEESALETLKEFIKEETGLDNDIVRMKDWRELTDKLVKGDLHLGVYQGYEFAWAQEKQPQLKPLALAVNVYRYPIAYVVTQRDNAAKDFAGLQGQSISIPANGQR